MMSFFDDSCIYRNILYKPWNIPILSVSAIRLSKFIQLCSYHHNVVVEHPHYPKSLPVPSKVNPSPTLSPRQPLICFLSL